MDTFRVAVVTLNQFSLDFDGNQERILESIRQCIKIGAHMRIGPELEITGYSCDDAFFEIDTTYFSWDVLAAILESGFKDILIDVGMPIMKDSNLYNCRVLILNSRILLIRPKKKMAGNGIYREDRWFVPWTQDGSALFELPARIQKLTNQRRVPFSANVVLDLIQSPSSDSDHFRIGFEICEELWRGDSSHIDLYSKHGCHLVANSSGGYWEIRKLDVAYDFMKTATLKCGGSYAFSNLTGCDGARTCFYGRSLICTNGNLVAMTGHVEQLFHEVQIAVSDISPSEIDSYRLRNNLKSSVTKNPNMQIVFDAQTGFANSQLLNLPTSSTLEIIVENFQPGNSPGELKRDTLLQWTPAEELQMYASLWLWDYLRRTPPINGFILPLSGGIDSSATACLVYSMCSHLHDYLSQNPGEHLTPRIRSLLKMSNGEMLIPSPPKVCHQLLRCVYLASQFSGSDSKSRAETLSQLLGAEFVFKDFRQVYQEFCNMNPRSNSDVVSIRDQNLQARIRMVSTYDLSDGRLVLSSGNCDEALVGYATKYDCSSGDLNPIGSISKQDLRSFMKHFRSQFRNLELGRTQGIDIESAEIDSEAQKSSESISKSSVLDDIINAIPSAELTGESQSDEEDMQLTYEQLQILGGFRRGDNGSFGPLFTFRHIHKNLSQFPQFEDAKDLIVKIKRFFVLHARNRHKQTVLTPSLHAESYSPDDNRFDHRQIIFDTNWSRQFRALDLELEKIENSKLE